MKNQGYLSFPGRETPAALLSREPRPDVTGRPLIEWAPSPERDFISLSGCPHFPGEHAMRKLIVTAATAALLASGGAAFAAVKHTTGTVKSFDGTAMSLVLDDGSTFTLSKAFKDPGLQAGEKVRVSWDMSGKNKVAEAVKIMK
ncbi:MULTISPECIES: DUF1344 domain-containing protein [unclassified Mesorhizobium]|uniref:DUF1344 domain-containing protein n=2 Tax=Mesorhizobium TaxID=68287 RepID=UPI001FE1B8BB|nr:MULTISPECIES: DUF1344 domain-containing protein [unclassified Mesorhizobium]